MDTRKNDFEDKKLSADISFGKLKGDKTPPQLSPKLSIPKRALSKELEHLNVYRVKSDSLNFENRSKSANKLRPIFRKETFMSRKQQEINNENQRLLDKMTKIHTEKQEYAKLIERPIGKPEKTLNLPGRKRRLVDIMDKNKQILKHIKEQKSEYSIQNCNKWRGPQEKILKTLCKYPYQRASHTAASPVERNSPQTNKNIADFERYIQEQEKEHKEMLRRTKEKTPSSLSKLRALTPTLKTSNSPIIEDFVADSVSVKNQGQYIGMNRSVIKDQIFNEEKIVIFKKSKILQNKPFVVEISSMDRCFSIIAYNMENQSIFSLRIPKRKGQELFKQHNYDYDAVANQLRLIGNKLVLRLFANENDSLRTSRTHTPQESKSISPINSRNSSPLRNRSVEPLSAKTHDSKKLEPIMVSSSDFMSKAATNNKETASNLHTERVTNFDFSTPPNEIYKKAPAIEMPTQNPRKSYTGSRFQPIADEEISEEISITEEIE